MNEMSVRNKKMMFAGLFLSKFGKDGYSALGYKSFSEAYRSLAAVVGGPWRSVKQYRDEFDPAFEGNGRKGWHKNKMRPTRVAFLEQYGGMELDEFATLVQAQFAEDGDLNLEVNRAMSKAGIKVIAEESFAHRMMTGRGSEKFFEEHYLEVPQFECCDLVNTTQLGCGFDFQLLPPDSVFLGVEVKGLRKKSGQILMTDREFKMAEELKSRYFLYVVTNFASDPVPRVIENPLQSGIAFECKTNHVEQKVWTANLPDMA